MDSEPILMQFDCKSDDLGMSTLSPFGNIDYSKGSSDNANQFTGKEIDPESGLTYFGARYYNPIIGRWISKDPEIGTIIDPKTLNRYVYVLNNPLKYHDPDGMRKMEYASKLPVLKKPEVWIPKSLMTPIRIAAIVFNESKGLRTIEGKSSLSDLNKTRNLIAGAVKNRLKKQGGILNTGFASTWWPGPKVLGLEGNLEAWASARAAEKNSEDIGQNAFYMAEKSFFDMGARPPGWSGGGFVNKIGKLHGPFSQKEVIEDKKTKKTVTKIYYIQLERPPKEKK